MIGQSAVQSRCWILASVFVDVLPVCPLTCRAIPLTRGTADLQLVGDNDWFFPASMATGSQALSKVGPTDGAASRERAPGSVGALHPSRGAEDMYAQACTLFRAMVQMPHYAEEVRASISSFGRRIFATTCRWDR